MEEGASIIAAISTAGSIDGDPCSIIKRRDGSDLKRSLMGGEQEPPAVEHAQAYEDQEEEARESPEQLLLVAEGHEEGPKGRGFHGKMGKDQRSEAMAERQSGRESETEMGSRAERERRESYRREEALNGRSRLFCAVKEGGKKLR
jgi:hypothetical protein